MLYPCYIPLFDSVFDMYFIFYIFLFYIPLFDIIISFLMCCFFCMWVIYRIFFYHCYNGDLCFFYFMFVFGDKDRDYIIIDIPLCVCFLGSMIISGILFIYYFYDDFLFIIDYVIWIIIDL